LSDDDSDGLISDIPELDEKAMIGISSMSVPVKIEPPAPVPVKIEPPVTAPPPKHETPILNTREKVSPPKLYKNLPSSTITVPKKNLVADRFARLKSENEVMFHM